MSSTKETSMSRAHAFTNRGTMWLLNTAAAGAGMAGTRADADTTTTTEEEALQHAFDAFQQGADLFEAASKTIKDHGALAAVNLLIIQNRKQMKDITRRLNTLKIQERLRQMNLEKAEAVKQQQQQQQHSRALGLSKRTTTTGVRARSADTPTQTAAAAAASDTRTERTATSKTNDEPGTTTTTSSPSTATALNDSDKRPRRRRLNPAASILGSSSMYDHPNPISQRDTTTTTRALCRSPENRYTSASSAGGGGGQRLATTTAPSTCASSVYEPGGGGSVYTPGYGGGGGGASGRSSSLGSSSAALGAAVDLEDGMVYVAHPLGSSDPFARFWNMLETALDQMSNPVAFASMPTDLPQVIDPIHETMGRKHHHRRRKRHSKEEERDGAGAGSGGRDGRHAACEAMARRKSRGCERGKENSTLGKGKRADPLSDSSSGDSFCVISKESLRDDSSVHSGKSSLATTSRTQSVSTLHASAHSILATRTTIINGKTPEELALENTNLRSWLDTLSQRFQVLERELQTYKRNSEHRQEVMKSVVLGVRREAQKAIYQSQIIGGSVCLDGKNEKEHGDRSGASSARLGSPLRHTVGLSEVEKSSSPRQRIRTPLTYEYADEDPFAMDNDPEEDEPVETTPHVPVMATNHPADPSDGIDDVDVLRRRLQEVETENQGLKIENQRSRSHLQKYRDRFERMKVSSRAKKEAKLSTGGMQRASELPTLGEEGE